jgi:two-component system chemotaxis sensor kinase CheA
MPADQTMRDIFFEECDDLVTALSDGLAAMRGGQTDDETVNAVFRAVHSVKGAAGAFALDDLVAFAHTFETVLDAIRAHRLQPDDRIIHVLERAGDVLADLIDAARDDLPANAAAVDPVVADLKSFLGDDQPASDEFVFDALTLDFGVGSAPALPLTIRFRPHDNFYISGHDPLRLIQAVQALGPTQVAVDTSQVADSLDWRKPTLAWQLTIDGLTSDLPIREIFEFVEDLCDLTITTDSLAAPEPAPVLPEITDPAPAPVTPEPAPDRTPKRAATSSLRVDPERVDRLINAVGELIINQSVISQRLMQTDIPQNAELFADLDDYKRLAREIQEGVMAIRAQPVKPLFQRMERIAREAAEATGKRVDLITEGEGTEVDKTVVERLADPLTHMIRNAIDHGIEPPAQRIAAGKSGEGQLRLTARQRSGSIVIEIADDGAGLNRQRIRDIAISKNLIAEDAALTDSEIDHLVFAPGFSTAKEVTNLSGRGVGMDVVKTAITALGGRVAIASTAGQGTTFSITLPLTLAVMDGMIITIGGQTMVVPISNIIETIRPKPADLSPLGLQNTLLRIRGEYVPIIDLAERMGQPRSARALTDRVLLLIQTDKVTQCALAVDDIFDQRQVVVKSMQANYGDITGISGATILGDGKIALIIDPDVVTQHHNTYSLPTPATKELSHAAIN